jgi:hypothetical protein
MEMGACPLFPTGLFETTVKVGTETITIQGNVVDGAVKIGTAFK